MNIELHMNEHENTDSIHSALTITSMYCIRTQLLYCKFMLNFKNVFVHLWKLTNHTHTYNQLNKSIPHFDILKVAIYAENNLRQVVCDR